MDQVCPPKDINLPSSLKCCQHTDSDTPADINSDPLSLASQVFYQAKTLISALTDSAFVYKLLTEAHSQGLAVFVVALWVVRILPSTRLGGTFGRMRMHDSGKLKRS
jgi:hypothetical protein